MKTYVSFRTVGRNLSSNTVNNTPVSFVRSQRYSANISTTLRLRLLSQNTNILRKQAQNLVSQKKDPSLHSVPFRMTNINTSLSIYLHFYFASVHLQITICILSPYISDFNRFIHHFTVNAHYHQINTAGHFSMTCI